MEYFIEQIFSWKGNRQCVSYEVKWEQNEIRNAYKEELPPTEPCTLYDIVNEIGVVSSNAARF